MLIRLIQKIFLKIFKSKVVWNYNKYCSIKIGHAALYFKTDPFFLKRTATQYHHVNFWEALEIVKILNKLGYWVDVFDRTVDFNKQKIEDKYDIFVGISAGMSGKSFPQIASRLKKALKIAFVSSQDPEIFNSAVLKRYENFKIRHKDINLPMVGLKTNLDMREIINNTDAIFCEGENVTISQYQKYNKPIYQIFVPSSPKIVFNLPECYYRKNNKFLYFGSNRNILKGLDILIETFVDLPELELYICTPANEPDFNKVYEDRLRKVNNIHWIGFVEVGGKKFEKLTRQCAFVTLLSCSDSMATSITSCMRKGMIPVITPETDINIEGFGFLITDLNIESVKQKFISISKISIEDRVKRSLKSYLVSQKYTQDNFSRSFENSLIDLLVDKNLLNIK